MKPPRPFFAPTTPNPMPFAEQVVGHVKATRDYLRTCEDKSPHPVLNEALNHLISMLRAPVDSKTNAEILSHFCGAHELPELRGLLAACEYELEKYWAKKICRGQQKYTDFIYIDSYDALLQAEIGALNAVVEKDPKGFCFIGSGPMPLSAFGIKKHFTDASVQCVERDSEAFFFGKNVAMSSGVVVDHILSDAVYVDYSKMDVVFVASMVDNKRTVMNQIAATAKPGTIVGIRTVESLREFLYTPLSPSDIPLEFMYLDKTPYKAEHINTTMFYRLK